LTAEEGRIFGPRKKDPNKKGPTLDIKSRTYTATDRVNILGRSAEPRDQLFAMAHHLNGKARRRVLPRKRSASPPRAEGGCRRRLGRKKLG